MTLSAEMCFREFAYDLEFGKRRWPRPSAKFPVLLSKLVTFLRPPPPPDPMRSWRAVPKVGWIEERSAGN